MVITGPAKRLSIYIGESDQWRGKGLYLAILETLKHEGLAGATVTRGVAGFGAHSRIHTASIEVLSSDLPLVVEVVDLPERIDQAIALIGPMVREGLITVEPVEILKYTHRYLQPLPGDKWVREVMTREVVTVRPETPVADIMDLLIGNEFKAVPVVDNTGQPIGIISDGDLIARGGVQQRTSVAERLDAKMLADQLAEIRRAGKTARDIMTSPVITVHEESPLARAVSWMTEHGLKRAPVVNTGYRLVGILSRVDILRTVGAANLSPHESKPVSGASQTVGEVMNTNVPTVPLEAELVDIAEQMAHAGLKRVVVVDGEGRAVGSINDGDLVARIKPEARPNLLQLLLKGRSREPLPPVKASDLMTPSVLTGPTTTTIAEAIQQMLDQKRKRFVVVDDAGRPIGIVDRQTLLHAVAGVVKKNMA